MRKKCRKIPLEIVWIFRISTIDGVPEVRHRWCSHHREHRVHPRLTELDVAVAVAGGGYAPALR